MILRLGPYTLDIWRQLDTPRFSLHIAWRKRGRTLRYTWFNVR